MIISLSFGGARTQELGVGHKLKVK